MAPAEVRVVADIAERLSGVSVEGVEAVEARLGRPLGNADGVTMRGSTAVVPVRGPIFHRANMLTEISGATSIERLALDVQKADDDPAAESILLDIDSPGGQADGVIELAEHIRGLATPVIAYVGAKGASGAYALAAAADEIVVAKSAMLGSVGVVVTIRPDDADGSLEVVSSQSPDKRLDAGTDEGFAKVQALVDRLAEELIGTVAELRGIGAEDVAAWRGGIVVGSDAVAAGMADRVGSFEGVVEALQTPGVGGHMATTKPEPAMTRQELDKSHPDLVAAIKADALAGVAADAIEAAASERERIKAVLEMIDPGAGQRYGDLASMLWDGATSGDKAAVRVLAAERGKASARLASIEADTESPVLASVAPSPIKAKPAKKYATIEERADDEWRASAEIRSEFDDAATYASFLTATESGLVRRIAGRKAQ